MRGWSDVDRRAGGADGQPARQVVSGAGLDHAGGLVERPGRHLGALVRVAEHPLGTRRDRPWGGGSGHHTPWGSHADHGQGSARRRADITSTSRRRRVDVASMSRRRRRDRVAQLLGIPSLAIRTSGKARASLGPIRLRLLIRKRRSPPPVEYRRKKRPSETAFASCLAAGRRAPGAHRDCASRGRGGGPGGAPAPRRGIAGEAEGTAQDAGAGERSGRGGAPCMNPWTRDETVNFLVPELRSKARTGQVRAAVCFNCLAREAVARERGARAQFCREERCEVARLELGARALGLAAARRESSAARRASSRTRSSQGALASRRGRCEEIDLSRVVWPRPQSSSRSSSPPRSSVSGS